MTEFRSQIRLPRDLKDRLDAVLKQRSAPLAPPSLNSVFVLAIEEFVIKLEHEHPAVPQAHSGETESS